MAEAAVDTLRHVDIYGQRVSERKAKNAVAVLIPYFVVLLEPSWRASLSIVMA